jgi:hypothetical protein
MQSVQMVIVGLGVRPDTAVVKAAGMSCSPRGYIEVDEHLHTRYEIFRQIIMLYTSAVRCSGIAIESAPHFEDAALNPTQSCMVSAVPVCLHMLYVVFADQCASRVGCGRCH